MSVGGACPARLLNGPGRVLASALASALSRSVLRSVSPLASTSSRLPPRGDLERGPTEPPGSADPGAASHARRARSRRPQLLVGPLPRSHSPPAWPSRPSRATGAVKWTRASWCNGSSRQRDGRRRLLSRGVSCRTAGRQPLGQFGRGPERSSGTSPISSPVPTSSCRATLASLSASSVRCS